MSCRLTCTLSVWQFRQHAGSGVKTGASGIALGMVTFEATFLEQSAPGTGGPK